MIALGSDHGGFALKSAIIKHLENRGLEYKDYGCYNTDSCDYPVFGSERQKRLQTAHVIKEL